MRRKGGRSDERPAGAYLSACDAAHLAPLCQRAARARPRRHHGVRHRVDAALHRGGTRAVPAVLLSGHGDHHAHGGDLSRRLGLDELGAREADLTRRDDDRDNPVRQIYLYKCQASLRGGARLEQQFHARCSCAVHGRARPRLRHGGSAAAFSGGDGRRLSLRLYPVEPQHDLGDNAPRA